MPDVSALHRPDRRQRLWQLRKLPIHYAVGAALAGVILGFVILADVLQMAVAQVMGLERYLAMPPAWGNVISLATIILGAAAGLLAAAYIWMVRQGKMAAGGRHG